MWGCGAAVHSTTVACPVTQPQITTLGNQVVDYLESKLVL